MKSASEITSSRVNVTIDDRAVYLCGFIAPILTAPTEQLPRYWELIRDAIKQQIQEAIDDTTEPARARILTQRMTAAEYRRPRKHTEDDEQRELIRWARLHAAKYPELGLLFHIPNGGKRNSREAARLKAQGVVAGVSDLLLPIRRDRESGMWLEMKSRDGRLTLEQLNWQRAMVMQGFRCWVCYSWAQAARAIIDYLGLPLEAPK